MMNRVETLTRAYGLEPHPEGGAFSEVYTAPFTDEKGRPLAGSIYFLLNGADISHLHVIDCDELWYYHEGCGMRVTLIDPSGRVSRTDLGPDLAAGQRMMIAIPRGTVFAAENLDPSGYSFVSCATAPKVRYEGFALVDRARLERLCPDAAESLARLAYPGEARGV